MTLCPSFFPLPCNYDKEHFNQNALLFIWLLWMELQEYYDDFYYKNKDFNPLDNYNENKLFNRNSKVFMHIETLLNGESHAPVLTLLLLLTQTSYLFFIIFFFSVKWTAHAGRIFVGTAQSQCLCFRIHWFC